MRLLRLLTAGRSLIGLKETARFREADPKSMPKFGGKRQPFRPSLEGGAGTSAAPTRDEATRKGEAAIAAEGEAAGGWFSRWTARGRRKPEPIPRFNKLLVQAELSLDRVKVLRNDLSDCDLEVRTAERAEKPDRERGRAEEAKTINAAEHKQTVISGQ